MELELVTPDPEDGLGAVSPDHHSASLPHDGDSSPHSPLMSLSLPVPAPLDKHPDPPPSSSSSPCAFLFDPTSSILSPFPMHFPSHTLASPQVVPDSARRLLQAMLAPHPDERLTMREVRLWAQEMGFTPPPPAH